MKYFLTSSHCRPGSPLLNSENEFAGMLKKALGSQPLKMLFITSDPDNTEKSALYSRWEYDRFTDAGYTIERFSVLDSRNAGKAAELVADSNFIILSGGHVPTQNRFFTEINLKKHINSFDGVILGISAGSMNSAETVYAQPEIPGEATDPDYKRFISGLGITDINIIPHYNMIKDDILDGMRLFEDIAFPDSMGRKFHVLPDGSFIYGDGTKEKLYGSGFILADGAMTAVKDMEL